MTVFYLNDPDSVDHPDRIHRATVTGRPRIHRGTVGWRVEIEPPLHGIRSAILAEHYVGTSLDELVGSGIGITPSWRQVPVYVVTAVGPASIDQDEFGSGEVTIAAWADAAVRPSDLTGPQHRPVPPGERLPVAVVDLERAWRLARAPIVPHLAPGLPAATVKDALAAVDLDPVPELVTWFAWHNGTTGNRGLGYETWSLDSGVFLQSLDECMDLYRQAVAMTKDLASRGTDPSEYYPAPAFPITRHLGPYLDVVSCDPARAGLTWFVTWDGEAEPNGPHLADLVERVARRWKMGATSWQGDRWAPRDEAWLKGPDVPW